MKELFREPDFTIVGYYQTILESEGIRTHVRNESLHGTGLAEIPIPDFFPALCVVNEEDYGQAMEIIREHRERDQTASEEEFECPHCKEMNPGNFELCWNCGKSPFSEKG